MKLLSKVSSRILAYVSFLCFIFGASLACLSYDVVLKESGIFIVLLAVWFRLEYVLEQKTNLQINNHFLIDKDGNVSSATDREAALCSEFERLNEENEKLKELYYETQRELEFERSKCK